MTPNLRDLLGVTPSSGGPTDPLEIFDSLSLRNSGVAELWRPQSDALREWDDHRQTQDILIKLNTGAGKTLLGLIVAQSLVNETRGKVLYVCATNQLLQQTKEKAIQYGVTTSEYYGGDWRGEAFHRADGPGLTNYQAVFNGKSVFGRQELAAVVFDDAHTAHGIIRDQYTLRIEREKMRDLYDALVRRVRSHFVESGRSMLFEDVARDGRDPSVLFVPTFVSSALAQQFVADLEGAGVDEERSTLFAWEHLRHRLADCAMFVDQRSVEFTPPLVPLRHSAPFKSKVRRVYLSATLPDDGLFCRTFGSYPDRVIEPGGRAGDTERLILYAHADAPDEAARRWAKELIEDRKALVMVPSFHAADAWLDVADVFRSTDGHERVRTFAASENEKLVFVARYDGVDLPGDDCRMMVVDGLPVGVGLLDRFFENHLEVGKLSDATIASRIAQLLGRISRGMSDFGVVLLVGLRLSRWLAAPQNRARLPRMIRRQLDLSDVLGERYEDFTPASLVTSCLTRSEDWIQLYDGFMESDERPLEADVSASRDGLPVEERKFIEALWAGDYRDAAEALDKIRSQSFAQSRTYGAWLLHWQAHALAMAGADIDAERMYREASKVSRELGRLPYRRADEVDAHAEIGDQARGIHDILANKGPKLRDALTAAAATLLAPSDAVESSSAVSTAQHEEAVRTLGEFLGFRSVRPDKKNRTGPDVVWSLADDTHVLFELKTGKTGSVYRKDDIGQLHDHLQWGRGQLEGELHLVLVGPRMPASDESHPPEGVAVVAPSALADVAQLLSSIVEQALDQHLPLFRLPTIEKGLEENGLMGLDVLQAAAAVPLDNLGTIRPG